MRLKHHILLYTFLGAAVLISVFLTLDFGNRLQRSAPGAGGCLCPARVGNAGASAGHRPETGKNTRGGGCAHAGGTAHGRQPPGRQRGERPVRPAIEPYRHERYDEVLQSAIEYTMVLALSVSAGQPLSQQQTTELSSLESQCALLLGQFATARETMVAESLRLTAQPGVFYAEAQAAQRPPGAGGRPRQRHGLSQHDL